MINPLHDEKSLEQASSVMSTVDHGSGTNPIVLSNGDPIDRSFENFFQKTISPLAVSSRAGTSIGILGVSPKCGATTVAVHAAYYSAVTLRRKTLLVDANFGSPCIGSRFGVASPLGWTDLINDPDELEIVQKATSIDRLSVIPAGANRVRSRKNLKRIPELVEALYGEASVVLFDLPPTRKVEPLLLKSLSTNVLVVAGGRIHSGQIRKLAAQFAAKKLPLSGLFINEHRSLF